MKYCNDIARFSLLGFGIVTCLLGILTAISPEADSTWFGILMVLVGGALGARALMASTVIVSEHSVVLRSFFRTRVIPLEDVASADLAQGATGFAGPRRIYLRLVMKDGSVLRFRELNASASSPRNDVRAAASHITRLTQGATGNGGYPWQ